MTIILQNERIKMDLKDLGWNMFFSQQCEGSDKSCELVGRVINIQKDRYLLCYEQGEKTAKLSGAFRFHHEQLGDYPVVGDWVKFSWAPGDDFAVIHSGFKRQNSISRAAAGGRGTTESASLKEQVIAANIDTVFLVSGLDRDFNLRRIERYLSLVYESGANPVVILNKVDLCDQPDQKRLDVEGVAIGVPILMINAQQHEDLQTIGSYLMPGYTAAFLGSSGVGKSTIINGLLGQDRQKVNKVSDHVGKGQHTTTTRELIVLPQGGMVIDTPGMRELQLIESEEGVKSAFEDIEALAELCRFSDCSHESEPGCAVQEAIQEESLDPGRLESYFKLKKEAHYISERDIKSSEQIEKEKWKKIRILQRNIKKNRFG